jgi:hypothetical protein
MQGDVMFLDCPAHLDEHGAARCGLPAEVKSRFTVRSTGGPLEGAKISCPRGHWFNGPIAALTWNKSSSSARGRGASPARTDATGS